MEIKKAVIDELINCKWLENCGELNSTKYDFETVFQSDRTKVIKSITSMEWENICLEERGNITSFLATHNKTEYNKNWNVLAKQIKSEVLPQIVAKIEQGVNAKNLPDSIIEDIKFNLVTILISDAFSKYYISEFYDSLLKIYTAGHLPCGWDGEFPVGKIVVF